MPIIKIVPFPGPQGPQGEQGEPGQGGGSGLTGVKTVFWQYPTEGAYAIQNAVDGEAISLKSSNSAALRWHVRDGGPSVAGYVITASSVIQQTGEMGVGPYQVQFAIDTQESAPPVGYYYYVNYDGPWSGSYISTASTTTTLTLEYPGPNLPGANEEFTGGTINPPSIYNQVEARSDGIWIKNQNWTEEPYYNNQWLFKQNGSIKFPDMTASSRTGYGETFMFGTPYLQQIITGPKTTEGSPTATRMVISGQDGYPDSYGEGGDLYLWAGRGGSAGGSGGDIKVDAGDGGVLGEGGTVKVRGGNSTDANGGFVEIRAGGSSTANGGQVSIHSGYSNSGTAGNIEINSLGSMNITSNTDMTITSTTGNMQFFMDGGMYIGAVDSGNQIIKRSELPTGATGSFVSSDGKTITVSNGIITGIA